MFFCSQQLLSWELPQNLENETVVIEGYVASLPEKKPNQVSFVFALKKLNGKVQKTKILLDWYHDQHPIELTVGDYWQLYVKLKRPHGLMNPGGFDYERWLFENGIRATGYVRENPNNRCLKSQWWQDPIDRIRQHLNVLIEKRIGGQKLAELIPALTIGFRGGISEQEWDTFRRTGTMHLMAIAGLHVGFVSGLMFFLVSLLWRYIPRAPLWMPAPQVGAIGALFAASVYSALAGFSLPTLRALTMITVFMLSLLLRRQLAPWHSFCLALFVVLIITPLGTLSAGFWLSFGMVAIILYGLSGEFERKPTWQKFLRIQWIATVGLMPMTLLFFQQVSFVSFVANCVAVPWIGLVIVPLSLCGILLSHFTYSQWILLFVVKQLNWLWLFLSWLATKPYAVWQHTVSNKWVLFITTVGILILLRPKKNSARKLGLVCLLPLIFCKPAAPKRGEIWFTLLDVGQGLSAVIQTQHHVLVYDTGPKYPEGFDAGESVVIPFLQYFDVKKIDTLMISHGDNDHIGGSDALLKQLQVNKILTSVPKRFPKETAKMCQSGQAWQWDGVYFQVLWPPRSQKVDGNNTSCILRVDDGKQSILLTGDIEAKAEKQLVDNEKQWLRSDILVAPHHGSKTSSSLAFVEAVSPHYVLFPVGYQNRYHFPHPSVLARYTKSHLLTTAASGAISFYSPSKTFSNPVEYRKESHRYWRTF